MTINDMVEQGVTFQGERVVTSLTDDMKAVRVLYLGNDEWGWGPLDDEWADWDVNYIHPRLDGDGDIEIELDNPNC